MDDVGVLYGMLNEFCKISFIENFMDHMHLSKLQNIIRNSVRFS